MAADTITFPYLLKVTSDVLRYRLFGSRPAPGETTRREAAARP